MSICEYRNRTDQKSSRRNSIGYDQGNEQFFPFGRCQTEFFLARCLMGMICLPSIGTLRFVSFLLYRYPRNARYRSMRIFKSIFVLALVKEWSFFSLIPMCTNRQWRCDFIFCSRHGKISTRKTSWVWVIWSWASCTIFNRICAIYSNVDRKKKCKKACSWRWVNHFHLTDLCSCTILIVCARQVNYRYSLESTAWNMVTVEWYFAVVVASFFSLLSPSIYKRVCVCVWALRGVE